MTYTMTVNEVFDRRGAAFAAASTEVEGRPYETRSRHGATMKLARQMVADGLPDGPWRAISLDGAPRSSGPSLHRLATLTVQESDRRGPVFRRYRPMDQRTALH